MGSTKYPVRSPGRSKWYVTLVLAAGVATVSPPTWAQTEEVVGELGEDERPWAEGVSEAKQDQAREIFAKANRSMQDGLFAQAAAGYRETLALWDHPGAHFNLGLAQINLDQPIEAYASFGMALRFGPTPLLGKAKYEQAQRYRDMLEKQLARIEVVCAEEGAAVTLNGQIIFRGPGRYEGMVRPGGHQIVASKSGLIPATEQAVLSPGEHRRYDLALTVPESMKTERRWAAWKPWAVVGAGALLMVGAGYLDYDSSQSFDRFDREFDGRCGNGCPGGEVPQALEDTLARAEREQMVARISYAVGSTVLATGVALLYLNREQLVRRGGRAGAERSARVSPVPVRTPVFKPALGSGQASIQVELRF